MRADVIVLGDGVSVWPQVLSDIRNGCAKPQYAGSYLAPYRDLPARAAELGFPIADERLATFVREHSEQESWTVLQVV